MAKNKKPESPETQDQDLPVEEPAQQAAPDAAADAAPAPADDPAQLLAAEKDRYLRLAAEYDNYRKRSAKERAALYDEVRSDTILQLLPVYDNLERALKQETSDAAFYEGVKLTMNQMESILSKMGVVRIPALGETFDPTRHNAIMHVEDESVGEKQIVEEFQAGFTLGDKVIRYSMVKVAN